MENTKYMNRAFCSGLLKLARQEFSKHLPARALKGMWTYKYSDQYEVQIPPNEFYPKGVYWNGQADNASDAKAQLIHELIENAIEKKARREALNLTENEAKVIKAFMENDIVSDHGWEHPEACTWTKDFHDEAGLDGKTYSGVFASLTVKELVWTNGEYWGLTELGREAANRIERKEKGE